MEASSASYLDPFSGETYPLSTPRWRSSGGTPLLVTPLPGIDPGAIRRDVRSIWRYAAALPVAVQAPITLGEGSTPLIEHCWRGTSVRLKLEWFAPTGSFKDRGASVMLSLLRQQGITHVLEDSSGNGGAAIAAYAAAGGLRAKILVPETTPDAKIVQMRAYGAEIELVPGTRQATADEAVRQSERIFYASHNWHAFFLQGTKTLAYELWEDLGFRAPDNVIMPMGAGSLVLGCDIGFGELRRRGLIDHAPRLFGVQPAHCAPLYAAFARGTDEAVGVPVLPTLAEGASIAHPVRRREVLQALRGSGGGAVAVSEAQIEAAALELARSGIYTEPTSALAAAACDALREGAAIRGGETTVLVLTGTGLKATQRYAELLECGSR